MDTKNLNSRQVYWAQKLFEYYFQIDYRQDRANVATNVLSWFPQRSQSKKEELRAVNTQIFHRLQILQINASLSGLSLSGHITGIQAENLSPLQQVFIDGNYILPRLRQFWEEQYGGIGSKEPY